MTFNAFIEWGLQTGLAVMILVALIIMIRRPFSKFFGPKAAYALWALPALRLIMPPVELAWLAPIKAALPTSAQTFAPADLLHSAQPVSDSRAVISFWDSYGLIMLAVIWALGVAGFWAWQIQIQRRTVKYWLTDRELPSSRLLQQSVDLAAMVGLKTAPALSLSPHISGPLVTGLRQPHIILPVDFETAFTAEEQHYALLHEIAHIHRKDIYASAAALFVRALNWPNPLVHMAVRYFRSDQEAACDASVLSYTGRDASPTASHAYGQVLIKAARLAQTKQTKARGSVTDLTPVLTLTIHHPLKERLMTLSNPNLKAKLRYRLAATAIVAIAFTATAPISLVHAAPVPQAEQPTPPSPPSTPQVEFDKDIRIIRDGKQTHVIQSRSDQNGVTQERKVETNVDGDKVTAFEIDPVSGTKTEINPETIEGYEHITQSHGSFKIDNDNGQNIRFEVQEGDSNVDTIIERLKAEGKLDGGSAIGRVKVLRLNEDGDENVWISEEGEESHIKTGVFTFTIDDDDFPDGFDLEDPLKDLKSLHGRNVGVVFANTDIEGLTKQSQLQATEVILETARSMLNETSEASQDIIEARKKLKEAMIAIEEAKAAIEAAQ